MLRRRGELVALALLLVTQTWAGPQNYQYNAVSIAGPDPPPSPEQLSYVHPYKDFSLHTGTTGAPMSTLRAMCNSAPNGRGMVAHEMYCDRYVDCWDGRALEKICPYGQLFSDLPGGFCDFREYVDCGYRIDPGTNPLPAPPPLTLPGPLSPMPAPPKPTEPPAPKDFIKLANGGYYFFAKNETDFYTARSICKNRGPEADLVVIETAEENQALVAVIVKEIAETQAQGLDLQSFFYNGLLRKASRSKEFRWIRENSPEVSYVNWGPYLPDNVGSNEDCVTIDIRGAWNDVACSNSIRFICEWIPSKPTARFRARG